MRRATYIKGDPYIRDMKHTRSIIHMHRLTSSLAVFANFCQLFFLQRPRQRIDIVFVAPQEL